MDRQPAVSGFFYPSERNRLRELLSTTERNAGQPETCANPMGVLVPHAGIVYSGITAMHSYKALSNSANRRFVIIGPNHNSYPPYAASYPGERWITPLGSATIDVELRSFFSGKSSRIRDDASAHASEHSVEVQLPFLQYLFGNDFTFYPLILGDQSIEAVLEISEFLLNLESDISFIFSSDMTHYESDLSARKKDLGLSDTIMSLDVPAFYKRIKTERISACGYGAIALMMRMTKQRGGYLKLLDYRTSGDTGGDRSSVVGYSSMVSCLRTE